MQESINSIKSFDVEDLKKGFIQILSHYLKTPIISQIRVLDMLKNGTFGELSVEQHEMISMILESNDYMYEMVSTLISMYKFDVEDFKLNCSDFNILELLEKCIVNVNQFLEYNNLKIVVIPDIKKTVVCADYVRLEKVIQTLLFNSLNSAFKNSVVKIYINDKKNMLNFKIENNSVYMPKEKIDKMFHISSLHSEDYNKIGIGIGLYLVKKIIEKHNGKIFVESNLSQKNTFGFEMPLQYNMKCYKSCV